jgi:multiple sugar transport system permease protein
MISAAPGTKIRVKKRISRAKLVKYARILAFKTFRTLLILSLMYMILYPLLSMIARSFVHPHVINTIGSLWIPPIATIDNYKVAWHVLDYLPTLGFTMFFITVIMVLQLANSAFAGYAFARLRFKGIGIFFMLVIVTIVVPTQVFFLPQYIMFRNFDVFGIFTLITGSPLNLLGEPTAMFVMAGLGQGLSGGIFIFIFRQFFRGLPTELEEAAYVDGAGVLRTFFRIALPLSKPAILTVCTLSFIWNWNSSFFQSVFHQSNSYLRVRITSLNAPGVGGNTIMHQFIENILRRLPNDVAIIFPTNAVYDAHILNVANLLSILPLVLLFLIVQKQFVEGVERSGIVG